MNQTTIIEIPDSNMAQRQGKGPLFVDVIPKSLIGLQIEIDAPIIRYLSSSEMQNVKDFLIKIEDKARKDDIKVKRVQDLNTQKFIYSFLEWGHTALGDNESTNEVKPQ